MKTNSPLQHNNDLFFYLYTPLSRCSEARLQRVKNGVTLSEVTKAQKQALGPSRLSEAGKVMLDTPEPAYYPLSKAAGQQPSPAMREYLRQREFSPSVERKKLDNLPSFFFVFVDLGEVSTAFDASK
jgi:hypothetical protein